MKQENAITAYWEEIQTGGVVVGKWIRQLYDVIIRGIAEDGLTVEKTYKTGSVEVAHPLLSELPRHVESANKCLSTIGNMIGERGARIEKAARDLDAFRLH